MRFMRLRPLRSKNLVGINIQGIGAKISAKKQEVSWCESISKSYMMSSSR